MLPPQREAGGSGLRAAFCVMQTVEDDFLGKVRQQLPLFLSRPAFLHSFSLVGISLDTNLWPAHLPCPAQNNGLLHQYQAVYKDGQRTSYRSLACDLWKTTVPFSIWLVVC
jgi:hypothetical protein